MSARTPDFDPGPPPDFGPDPGPDPDAECYGPDLAPDFVPDSAPDSAPDRGPGPSGPPPAARSSARPAASDSASPSGETDLRRALRAVFGFPDFLGLQRPIIEHVMAGGDAVALMPTGSGKSLTYQLPAILLPGTGVVVSPLIALMQDQVTGLVQAGVRAAYLNSSLCASEASDVVRRLFAGELDLLYVAPERLLSNGFLDMLARIRVCLFAIDEAHCVSQWGHDFRPEYTQLSVLAERFPGVPRLALTATADGPTRKDIVAHLALQGARVFAAGFDRPNIRYHVVPKDHPRRQLLKFIEEEHPEDAGIVYRTTRKEAERTAAWLAERGRVALPYHAGLTPGERSANMERFMREEGVIICATVAFGMGVDKPNVRFVAHLDPPKSLEAYHQETGRAGRDGLPADAFMTYGLADVVRLAQMVDSGSAEDAIKRVERHKLFAMLGYCECASCRRQALLGYFGETLAEPCGNCDNCLRPVDTYDGTVAAQKALSCIYRTGQRFGAAHLSDILLGNATKRVSQFQHDRIKTFGCGTELDRSQWTSVFRQLTAAGLVTVDIEGYGSLRLNAASWEVLKGERSVTLRKDPPKAGKTPRREREPRGPRWSTAGEEFLDTGESRELWASLRAVRTGLATEQKIPPYAVFSDRTLMEMVLYRPRDEGEFALLSGVGRAKLTHYAEPFLAALAGHEDAHGRPDTVRDFPEERREEKTTRQRERDKRRAAGELNDTAAESLKLFEELGDAAQVAERRGLKPGTVMNHLAEAVRAGRIDVCAATGLTPDDVRRIAETLEGFHARGVASMTPVFESLGGKYPYELLRIVRASLLAR
ncbi:MAG: DNA helicase RecQ [Desulfovibrionaceae bacterium]|jgi:ATP-dependent DNA helicase RecQ|nr:DNA helicase RecQ [Desulfovibrionaceae bacterium]